MSQLRNLIFPLVLLAFFSQILLVEAAPPENAPDRFRGEGPFNQLILRGVIFINGEGAPPR